MSTIQSNLTDHEMRELHAWAAEVRATYAQLSQPIHEEDPRYNQMRERRGSHISQFTPEDLGHLYAAFHPAGFPAWPLPLPGWVVESEISTGTYPEMCVKFVGKDWKVGEFTARVEQLNTFFVDDFVDSGGIVTDHIHDLSLREAKVYVPEHGDDLTATEASQLAATIEAAAEELRHFTNDN